jgi:antitoxin PrlF
MTEARLISRGRVAIPADIRRSLGLVAHDRLSFTPMPDGTVLLPAKNKSILELRGMLIPAPGSSVSIAEMSFGSP